MTRWMLIVRGNGAGALVPRSDQWERPHIYESRMYCNMDARAVSSGGNYYGTCVPASESKTGEAFNVTMGQEPFA